MPTTKAPPRKPKSVRTDGSDLARHLYVLEVVCATGDEDHTLACPLVRQCQAGKRRGLDKCPGNGDCGCPVLPCEHVEAADHDVPLSTWAAALLLHDPVGYGQPPLDPEPAVMLSPDVRIAVMTVRAAEGHHLYHPSDLRDVAGGGAVMLAGRHDVRSRSDGLSAGARDKEAAGPTLHEQVLADMRTWERTRDILSRREAECNGHG